MTSEAQPGQEQRMVTDASDHAIQLATNALRDPIFKSADDHLDRAVESAIYRMHNSEIARLLLRYVARPTADLGDDGELVADLEFLFPNTDGVFGDREVIYGEVARKAHDRLILYREALEVLLLVKDAVDYRGDACHPAEMVGAVLDKCILERIDAVLSRSGG